MATEPITTPPHWGELLKTALELEGQAGNTYSRFRRFSFGNQALLFMQSHIIEPQHTLKGWNSINRRVKKGSKAKAIYVPMFRKEEKDGELAQRLSGFKLVRCMFGVSDTEGEDLPAWEPPHWSKDKALEELGITEIPFSMMDGNCQGFGTGTQIAISPIAVYPFKTLIHEVGHVAHGHTTDEGMAEYQGHRGLYEFQAESTAYLVLNDLGALEQFSPAESRAYIQTWLRGEEPPEQAIKRVFTVADKIIRAGMEEDSVELAEAS